MPVHEFGCLYLSLLFQQPLMSSAETGSAKNGEFLIRQCSVNVSTYGSVLSTEASLLITQFKFYSSTPSLNDTGTRCALNFRTLVRSKEQSRRLLRRD